MNEKKPLNPSTLNINLIQNALDSMSTMMAIKSLDGYYIFCNDAVNKYYKEKHDTIVGLHVTEVYDEQEAKAVMKLDQEVIKKGTPIHRHIEVYTEKGYITVDLQRSPIFDEEGNLVAIMSTGKDVTETEKLRKELIQKNIELEAMSKMYKELAHIDELTRLENRRKFYQDFQSLSTDQSHQLIITDLNNFKLVNDELGHDTGDKVLYSFAQYMKDSFKTLHGRTYRLSGDEFAILITPSDHQTIKHHMSKVDHFLRKHHEKLSIAYGYVDIANNQDRDKALLELSIRRADELMYSYKDRAKS